jgi:hypothetical protein
MKRTLLILLSSISIAYSVEEYQGFLRIISFEPRFTVKFAQPISPGFGFDMGIIQSREYFGITFDVNSSQSERHYSDGTYSLAEYYSHNFIGGGITWCHEKLFSSPFYRISPGISLGVWGGGKEHEIRNLSIPVLSNTISEKSCMYFGSIQLRAMVGYKYAFLFIRYNLFIGNDIVNLLSLGIIGNL